MHPAGAGLNPARTDRRASRRRWLLVAALGLLLLLGAVPFFTATTFIGDDHVFLAFSRYEDHPLRAFVADVHGGEFYRPIPMLVWWLIGRVGGGTGSPPQAWPFAALGFFLHSAVAALTGAVLWAARRREVAVPSVRAPTVAAACFFLAPLPREAAYWFAASTDLMGAAFGLAAIVAALLEARWIAATAFALACGCKETALVFPLLAMIALRTQHLGWPQVWRRLWPMIPVAVIYGAARTWVLGGLGGAGDAAASARDKGLQIAAGLVQLLSGDDVLSEPFAALLGVIAWAALLLALCFRREDRSTDRGRLWIGCWIAVSVAPLLAAPWIVGARYFYVAAIGGFFLVAEALERFSSFVTIGVLVCLGGLSGAQAFARHADVMSYGARLAAVRLAVTAGVTRGHRVFHINAGIKDVDLAVKEDPALKGHASSILILGDVPASFVLVPDSPPMDPTFLQADPALPPSGAYRFGHRRIVGLARRGADPTLEEVLTHFPDLRLIRLRPPTIGIAPVRWRDATEELLAAPEPLGPEQPTR